MEKTITREGCERIYLEKEDSESARRSKAAVMLHGMQTSVHKVRRTYMQYRGWFLALTDRDRQGTDSDLSCAGFFFFFFFSFLFFFFSFGQN